LYSEELQSQHSTFGYAHRDALKWLNFLSIALSKQDNKESLQKANEILEASIFNILKKEKSSQRLADSGLKIAEIYLNSGLRSDGEHLLSQLRSQAVFGVSNVSKKLNLSPGTKLDPSAWVFIITFGVTLSGRKESFSSAMADLVSEFFMYEEYQRSTQQKGSFLTTLEYGSRLLQFTTNIGDISGTAIVESQLLEYFSANLNAPKTTTKTVLAEFLQLVLVQIHTLEPDINILKIGSQVVNAYLDQGKVQEAHDWGYLLDRFQQFQGGYDSLEKIDLGLQVALVLAGRGNTKFQDSKTDGDTFKLSQSITKQIMETVRSSDINVMDVSIDLLNDACGLLGDHRNLNDLEVSNPISTWQTHSNDKSSGFSLHSGRRATNSHPGQPPPCWALADALWRRNLARGTRAKRLPSVRTSATICDAYGDLLMPQPWTCLLCSHPSTQLLATIARPCWSTRTLFVTPCPTRAKSSL
jgi:hypothetical protein